MEELTLTADTITINKHELYDVLYSIFSLEKIRKINDMIDA